MRVFICYARVDQSFALPLAEQLKARGVEVWIDKWNARPGDDWDRDIDRGLRECSHLLIVLSPASIDSGEVRGEFHTFLSLRKPVLPVLHKPCEIPRQLRVIQYVDCTKRSPRDASALNEVLRGLTPELQELPAPAPPPPERAPRPAPTPPPRRAATEWRTARPGLNPRAKLLVKVALGVLLVGAAWLGLDMATEARRRLNHAALSPNGAYLATATGQGLGVRGAVRVWDVSSGAERAFLPIEGPAWVCAWSPDGKRLAVGEHSGTIRIYESDTWRETAALSGSRDFVQFIEWAPDGAALATGDLSGSLWVWDVTSGALRYSKPVQSDRIGTVTWSHDGTLLAVGGAAHWVALVSARDGALTKRLEGPASVVTSLAFSPDDEWLAAGHLEAPYVMVWSKSGARTDLQGHRRGAERVAWSSDGRFLASTGKDGLVNVWNAKLESVRRIALAGRYISGTALAWSPDGKRLAVGDAETVRIFNPESDTPLKTFTERSADAFDSVEIAGWSAGGTRIGTFNTSDRISSVWDVERSTRIQRFTLGLWRSLSE